MAENELEIQNGQDGFPQQSIHIGHIPIGKKRGRPCKNRNPDEICNVNAQVTKKQKIQENNTEKESVNVEMIEKVEKLENVEKVEKIEKVEKQKPKATDLPFTNILAPPHFPIPDPSTVPFGFYFQYDANNRIVCVPMPNPIYIAPQPSQNGPGENIHSEKDKDPIIFESREQEIEHHRKKIMMHIASMGVAQIRKALSFTRKAWESHRPENIFYPSHMLPQEYNMSFEDFNLHFVIEHHRKRHSKGKHTKKRSEPDWDSEDSDQE